MSRNGLKINQKKDEGQLTLSEAFAAGNLVKEAKTQRREMLKAQEEILVRTILLEIWCFKNFRSFFCLEKNFSNFWEKPILQGESTAFQGKFGEFFL